MKTIAVIGSNGALGADLVSILQSSYKVIPIHRDNYLKMKGSSFDILINANGNSKRFWANEHILEDFDASTTSVYRSIQDFSFKKYIYISSSDVYADHTRKSTTKEIQNVKYKSLSPYGFHKYLSESIVTKYVEDYVILRSCMILGKNLRKGPIYDLFQKKPLYISLDSKIQMINTNEIAFIIDFMIKKKISKKIFNMGGNGVFKFNDIESYTHIKPQISKDAKKQVYEMNISKLAKIYPLKTSSEYLKKYLIQSKLYETI